MNDGLLRPLKLSRDARKALTRLGRESNGPCVLFGQEQELCEHVLRRIVDPLLDQAGMAMCRVDQYHWFLREMAKLFRTRLGHDLTFSIELCMRKWVGFGLEPKVMGFLLCLILRELDVIGHEKPGSGEEPLQAGGSRHEPEPEDTS